MRKLLFSLLIILLLLNLFDCFSTSVLIKNGIYEEGNPIMKYLMDRIGITETLIFTKGPFLCKYYFLESLGAENSLTRGGRSI